LGALPRIFSGLLLQDGLGSAAIGVVLESGSAIRPASEYLLAVIQALIDAGIPE
jgi:hypothetical protein